MIGNRELHYRYGIGALIVALCAAVGFGLVDDSKLVDKVSFALTVNSLVLSVVAIVYSFLASNKQEMQLARLARTNSEISSAASEITQTAREMGAHLKELPDRFDNLGKKISELNLSPLKAGNEEIAAQLNENEPNAKVADAPPQATFTEYLTSLTYAGIAATYLYYKALEADSEITPQMTKRDHIPDYSFVVGNVQAVEASGYLKAKYSMKKIAPISMDQGAMQSMAAFVVKSQEMFDEERYLRKAFKAIDDLFMPN